MNEPAEHAETMREAYQSYLRGRGGLPARSAATRLEPDSAGETTLAGMRGPYLQALPIANWSETDWSTFAKSQPLHPNITRAFHQEGFRRLYDFQERSVERILAGDDTIISAATGRGKTEAWLIPILDQIVKSKGSSEDEDRTSTKALLMYPTKALAQDQFKRLVQILYRINRNLREKEWITVGIYDGDTPRHIYENKAQGYLNRTFRHFGCPGANDDLDKCQSCGQGVFVETNSGGFRLRPDKPMCEDDRPNHVPLDFVRLTRSEIQDRGADIILTNPDTVNYRLFNINGNTEQQAFVYEPEFLVFDEVHTYDGLLGSYTSTLVKRLRRLRSRRDCSPLQVIGSSATVANDEELFRQVSGASDISAVREDPRKLKGTPPDSIPSVLRTDTLEPDSIVRAGRGDADVPDQLGDVEVVIENAHHLDNERLEDQLANELFDQYTRPSPTDPVVQTFQSLHAELAAEPRPPDQFVEDCRERFDLTREEAVNVVENFQTAGQFAGLLESRHHLFSWPLDGFYACVACDAVYRSPQDQCGVCESRFVTRATYCKGCGDEYLIANACSNCEQLVPHVHTEEGLLGEDEFRQCPHCAAVETEVTMHRVTFRPHTECADCGTVERRTVTATCGECGTQGVPTDEHGFVCRNPQCESTWERPNECGACGSSAREAKTIDSAVDCRDCDVSHPAETLPTECRCGAHVQNRRFIPWACSDEECDEVHFDQNPPKTCSCGDAGPFVKAGLYEISVGHECLSCGEEYLDRGECECTEPLYRRTTEPYRRYRTWDHDRQVRSPLKFRNAISCDHDLHSTVVGAAYDELMRSPTNVAVTTSQYLLRDLAGGAGFSDAKLLAFSDSHRDMKELDRSFTEPEVDTVLDQLVLTGLGLAIEGHVTDELESDELATLVPGSIVDRSGDAGPETETWVSLEEVTTKAYGLLQALEDELSGGDARDELGLGLIDVVLGTEYIADTEAVLKSRLRRRATRHVGERPTGFGFSLETDGLVDSRLDPTVADEITIEEESVVAAIVEAGNNAKLEDIEPDTVDGHSQVVDGLVARGVLAYREDDRIALDSSVVQLTLPESGGLRYDPSSDRYYSQLRAQYDAPPNTVECGDSLVDRSDSSHPRFSSRAFTASRSRVALMLSRLYYGATPKMERREIEHLFREGTHPHFLSSGPTMEMGVDIGSLDTLLLYGTPPNMNAYLQRIGRAGRRSGSALVHSVSQRNPIDYYYYDEPVELISADKQPVPLNEHNERVLRISLAWAVLDYIGEEFVIPWKTTQHNVTGGESVLRRSETTSEQREEAAKFTKVLSRPVSQLDLDNKKSRLRTLGITIEDNEDEIRTYLDSMLKYAYCQSCNRHYDEGKADRHCPEDECDSKLVSALDEHGHLIDGAIEASVDVFVNGYRNYIDRLRVRISENQHRQEHLTDRLDDAGTDEAARLEREITQLDDRIAVLKRYVSRLAGESYFDVLKDAFSEYAFSLRTVSDSVEIEVVDESGEPQHIGDDRSGRSSRLALSELHPGAAYLHRRRPHIVAQAFVDEKKSTDLREKIETHAPTASKDIEQLATDFVCTECGASGPTTEAACECGESAWQERKLVALEAVEATLDTQRFPNELHDARQTYQRPGERIQTTFAQRETEILDFTPEEEFELVTGDGKTVGALAFGGYEVLEYTGSFRAKYQSGDADEQPTEFELCGEADCTGIIYEDDEGTRRCSVNADHIVGDGGASATYARMGYSYATEGVRVQLDADSSHAAHTLVHGLRLALQKLSGVTIRDVNEYIGTNHADVFDSLEGGAAVSRLLVQRREEEYKNFQSAMSLISKQFDCDCSDGCPRCLYQYGCAHRNRPRSFERDEVRELVESGLQLRQSSEGTLVAPE
jgi:ATP-dependent helicase YprA (DUF1998 family)